MTDLRISAMLAPGGTMKPLVKLLTDFITWRWAPAVGLLAASMIYVVVVVGLVPSEIGVPVANAKFEPQTRGASTGLFGGTPANVETNESSYGATGETRPVSTPPRPVQRAPVADFGRRGFSPPLARPEPPPTLAAPTPTPAAPPTTVAPAMPRGSFGGLFSRIQGALRPGSPAAQSMAEAVQARAHQVPSAAAAPSAAPSGAPPPAAAPNAPTEATPPQPPDAQQQPAPADSAAPAPSASAEAPAQ